MSLRALTILPSVAAPFVNTKTLKVNGSKSIDFGNHYDVSSASHAFSLMGWVYVNSSTNHLQIIGKQQVTSPFPGWALFFDSTGRFRFQLVNSAVTTLHYIDVETPASFTTGTWYQVIVSYSGSTLASGVKIYVSSTTAQTLTVLADSLGANSPSNSTSLTIAAAGTNAAFVGNLNQFAFFDGYTLTSTDVGNLITTHPASLTGFANLSSWWELNQLDTANAIDQVGGITGTWNGISGADYVSSTPSPP